MFSRLNDWPLSRKMFLAFGSLLVLFVAMFSVVEVTGMRFSDYARDTEERGLAATRAVADAQNEIRQYRILVFAHVNRISEADRINTEERLVKAHNALQDALETYATATRVDEEPGTPGALIYAELQDAITNLEATNAKLVQISSTRPREDAIQFLRTDGKEASHAAINAGKALMDQIYADRQVATAEAESASATMAILAGLLGLVGGGVLIGCWLIISRTVARPLSDLASVTSRLADGEDLPVPARDREDEVGKIAQAVEQFRQAASDRTAAVARESEEQRLVTTELSRGLNSLSDGDLTTQIDCEFPEAYVELKTNFNVAVSNLKDLIASVRDSAEGISTGANEIAAASEDLARRTESNAASLEETSASLTEIDGRLKASAEAAQHTVQRADGAIKTVGGGRAIADQAVQAMGRVSESAKGIDAVIEGLDKIAFQTRVLAMNAAVEAGRAGEAGKGFAVVADLVSALAMRAEEEAQLARDQLTVTQTDIGTAVDAVQKVDGALAEITEGVNAVHGLLGSMAEDNHAQSAAVSEISSATSNMDQATQQNAAMVEETSAAARNLLDEVTSLTEKAGRFHVGEKGMSRPGRAASSVKVASPARGGSTGLPPRKKDAGYVSMVKPLPAANGKGAADEWSDF